MFRTLSAHLQEDKIVYMQHMVLSLSTRFRGGFATTVRHTSSHSRHVHTPYVMLPHHHIDFLHF